MSMANSATPTPAPDRRPTGNHWVDDKITTRDELVPEWLPMMTVFGPSRGGMCALVPGNEKARPHAEALALLLDRRVYVCLEWSAGRPGLGKQDLDLQLFLTEKARDDYATFRVRQMLPLLGEGHRLEAEGFLDANFLRDAVAVFCRAWSVPRWLDLWYAPLVIHDKLPNRANTPEAV